MIVLLLLIKKKFKWKKLFYEKLYRKRPQLEKENSDFKKITIHQHVPKLSQDESQSIEGILKEQKTLMVFLNYESPGPYDF